VQAVAAMAATASAAFMGQAVGQAVISRLHYQLHQDANTLFVQAQAALLDVDILHQEVPAIHRLLVDLIPDPVHVH
jgi:hypothetical protein